VFALVNGLGRAGALSAAQEEFWTRTNACLDAHGISCDAVWSDDPGLAIYEDEHQVVVVPRL
jgi:hypothetical protein